MPRPDELVLQHFRQIVQQQSSRIYFENYTPSQSNLFYRECLRSNSYLKPLSTAVSISLRTRKYREQLTEAIDELIRLLPERYKVQQEVLERTFMPLPENSYQPVKLVMFREIQVFDESEVLSILQTKSPMLWRAVCVRIGLEDVLNEMRS